MIFPFELPYEADLPQSAKSDDKTTLHLQVSRWPRPTK
jgi:hypothetical protein